MSSVLTETGTRIRRNATQAVRDLQRARTAPIVLELDLTEPLMSSAPSDPVGQLLALRRSTVRDVVRKLAEAADDPRVAALIAKLGSAAMDMATVQELRDAVRAFAAAGKRTVAWAETFGELGPGTQPYYLACAFEQVWLGPSGMVGLTGIGVEARFLRDALDKLGVQTQIGKRHEYKNAVNTFTEKSFTEPHREAVSRLAKSAFEQIVAGVAEGRGITEERVRELVDVAPLSAQPALEAGLVDRLGYRDEVYADLRAQLGKDSGEDGDNVRLLYLARYGGGLARQLMARRPGRPTVAVISVSGAIRLGRSGPALPIFGGTAAGSDTVCSALRSATRSEDVAAIMLRVDSPGGSYVASDTIWRAVALARQEGMPVVVSMGSVAASGGYFVAMNADTIVAQPGTITGSIGVFGGKQVVSGLMDRIGVSTDGISEGANARMFSATEPFSDGEWQRLNDWLDLVYDDFTAKVAEGRDMSREAVHDVARGRVWSGADAKERGLVDVLGGQDVALALAREKAGLPDDAPAVVWPARSPLQQLIPPRSSEDPAASGASYRAGWGRAAVLAEAAGLHPLGPLALPWSLRLT